MKLAGFGLILLGILALAYQGLMFNKTEQVAQLGPFQIQETETKTIPIPPIVGGACVVTGLILVIYGKRRSL